MMVLLFTLFMPPIYGQEERSNPVRPGEEQGQARIVQNDSTSRFRLPPDTLEHSPRKAMIYSLALPGLGQGYNKKYFKIPIVYTALGGAAYWIYFNNSYYHTWLDTYALSLSSTDERYVKFWRRNLEISILTLAGVYALQVIDAYVDAHLYYWDVSPNLALRVEPTMKPLLFPTAAPSASIGISCKLNFK